jgi:probable HAF family extracellular repeat protein
MHTPLNNKRIPKLFNLHQAAAAIAVPALLMMAAPVASPQVIYSLADLGSLGGGDSYAYGINNSGQVAGYSYFSGTTHAFLCGGGRMTDLGTLSGSWSQAYAINNNGQVVGGSDGRAFLYSGGKMLNLGMLGNVDSCAYGINNQGQVVGRTSIPDGSNHAFLYSGGTMTDLGTLGANSGAVDINDNGLVVGGYTTSSGSSRSFLYGSTSGMTDIPNPFGGSQVFAQAINENGQVAGYASTSSGTHRGFLYSGGVMTDLGTLNGVFCHPCGLNINGQVVGTATAGSSWHAFLADGHTMIDLNNVVSNVSGWTLNRANSINDKGEIVGWGISPGGTTEAFLLTPIPEPTAVLLLGLSGAVILLGRRIC